MSWQLLWFVVGIVLMFISSVVPKFGKRGIDLWYLAWAFVVLGFAWPVIT